MTSIRALVADVLAESNFEWQISEGRLSEGVELAVWQAQALLASPLADIIDLAASVAEQTDLQLRFVMSAEVRALLESWRGSRAERPTP